MATQLDRARRLDYEGDQATLDYELQFLPPTVAEWHRRLELLVNELRQASPYRGALHSVIGDTEFHCIDGVITKVVHDSGNLSGEWTDLAYLDLPPRCDDLEQTEEIVLQDLFDSGLGQPMPGQTEAVAALALDGGEATSFEYSMVRDLPDGLGWTEDRLAGAAAPPEARLWFGMDVDPHTGQPKFVDLFDFGMGFAQEINRKYGIALPGANTTPNINDDTIKRGVNPLSVFADAIEAGRESPHNSLWHPLVIDMAAKELGHTS